MKNDDDDNNNDGRPTIRTETKYNVVSCYFCNEFIDSSDFKVNFLQWFAIYLQYWVTRHFMFCFVIKLQIIRVLNSWRGLAWHEMKVNLLFFSVVTPRWVQSSVTKMPERLFGLYSAQIFGTTFIELPKESKRQFNRQYRRPWRWTLCTRTEYHFVAVGFTWGN